MKNILLTTLGYTDNMTDIDYYYYLHSNGQKTFCTGISVAEAGAKFVLSRYQIDEIMVAGNESAINSNDYIDETALIRDNSEVYCSLDDYSEYAFFQYRMNQFFDGFELEGNDVKELLSKEEQDSLDKKYSELAAKYEIKSNERNLFYHIESGDRNSTEFLKELKSVCNNREMNYLNYAGYKMMNSYHKMYPLDVNKDVRIRYIPTMTDIRTSEDVRNFFNTVFNAIRINDDHITLYIDFQGLGFTDAFGIHNIISILKESSKTDIRIAGIIQSSRSTDRICNVIRNEWKRFDIQTLLSGVQEFLNYGKSETVFDYWKRNGVRNQVIEHMFAGMQYVEEGISLCNIDMLRYGVGVIRETLKKGNEIDLPAYHILKNLISKDYGDMLEGSEVSIPSLLEWTLKKGMYQQALSIVESHVPKDLVKRGIFYYADSNEDAENVKKVINVFYWNETFKCRYQYNDIDHFMLKNYGKDLINLRQRDKTQVDKDNAAMHVRRIHDTAEDVLPAYSCLDDDALLQELLFIYFQIGRLRNQVCHALPPEKALENGEEIRKNDDTEKIVEVLTVFLNIYKSACRKAENADCHPVIITGDEFRAYTNNHRLVALNASDGIMDQTVTCTFNEREVSIQIRMLDTYDADED
ncbi:MAG: hypothetical protein KBS51_05340 [Lachnospiraceae bacterium]|nr:hypothetical protein [Candidatus Darwinimomas equi]